MAQLVKNVPAIQERDQGLIPGLGRFPGEGKVYPLQYSGLENAMNCIVHRVAKSRTWLSYASPLPLGRKAMTNLAIVLKSMDITLRLRSV